MDLAPLRLPFDVTLRLPGSKSHANRVIVAACLAQGRTVIRDATPCDDVRSLVDGMRALGFRLEWFDPDAGFLVIDGGLPDGPPPDAPVEIDCGLAGTTLRFLTAVACLCPGEWILTGGDRLRERPIGDLVAALHQLGVEIRDADGCAPIRVRGGLTRGGTVTLDASRSSQFVTALMLIGAQLEGGLRIDLEAPVASAPYVEMTEDVLARFGVTIARNAQRIDVPAGGLSTSGDVVVEGDWSAAGAWLALAEVTRSRFFATNLSTDSRQGDRFVPLQLALLRAPGDVTLDVGDTPDQTMNLAVVAALRDGRTTIVGAANLRDKECDRLAVTCSELRKVGVRVEETADGLVVDGPTRLRPAALACHGDHRMAMAFATLGAVARGISIDDPGCVSKSYPGFFQDLATARHSQRCIALIGMRGVGKSTLAAEIATRLGIDAIDTDREFERQRGPIRTFVERSGFAAFRAIESGVLADALRPGRVVAVGGGALETPGNLDLVRSRALVVWVREDVATLVDRLAAQDRPPLTDLPLAEEVAAVLANREPVFASIAELTLAPGTTVDARADAVAEWLRRPLQRDRDAAEPAASPWTGGREPA